MLTALLDARPLSAGELARSANVSAQSASMHLGQLLAGGLLRVSQEGRYRYYKHPLTDKSAISAAWIGGEMQVLPTDEEYLDTV